MLYELTEDWKLLNELRGTFQNRGQEEIFLKNSDTINIPDQDGISIKPGTERYYEVSSGRIYAQTKRGEVLLAVEGFSPGSSVPAIVPPTLTEKVNKNGEDITAQGEVIAAQGDKIQNCTQALDSSIVAYIGTHGISGNVVGDDSINTGGNVIEGTGVSFVKTPEGFGIGKGYKNLRTNISFDGNSSDMIYENEKLTFTQKATKPNMSLSQYTYEAGKTYYISGKLKKIDNIEIDYIRFGGTQEAGDYTTLFSSFVEKDGYIEFEFSAKFGLTGTTQYFQISLKNSFDADTELLIENFSITETVNNVQFVPNSFRGGELKINEKFDIESETIIIYRDVEVAKANIFLCTDQSGDTNRDNYRVNSNDQELGKQFCVLSKHFKKAISENTEYTIDERLSENGGYTVLSSKYYSVSTSKLISTFKFLKSMTEEEIRGVIEIIKSKNYQLPPNMQGTTFPIEDMVRRADKYGIVNDSIEVIDLSRDLWYIEPGLYEVIDNNLVTHYVRVNADGSITGTALEDVSGRLRVAASITLPAQVRKVK